ncbi:hypothetical protein [Paeniglutamicibacter gangotriensis]|nr:hypothetical protein [Paeniglutamicibacter gangotriensis]
MTHKFIDLYHYVSNPSHIVNGILGIRLADVMPWHEVSLRRTT